MITFEEYKKELLKDPWVRFWYIVYWPKHFLIGLGIRLRLMFKK